MNEFLKSFAGMGGETPLKILLAGITYPNPTYRVFRKNSYFYVIEYVTDGEGYVLADGEMHKVCKDTVYLLRRGEEHDYYSDEKNPFTKIFINVTGSFCEQILAAYGLTDGYFMDGTGTLDCFEKIPKIIDSTLSESEMQAALQGVFVEILSRLSMSRDQTNLNREAVILKNHIDSNLDRIVETKELARLIFRSEDYCQKLFLKEFGTTPYKYQLRRKLEIAKSLLSHTRMPVGEIAQKLGYDDIHYFSNLFLKKCGMRPVAYRKSKK